MSNYFKTAGAAVLAAGLFILFAIGFRSEFQRSTEWWRTSIVVTALIAAVPAFLMMRVALRRGPSRIELRRAGFFSVAVLFLMMLVFASLFLYPIVGNLIPDYHTRVSGRRFEDRHVTFSKVESPSLRECTYQIRGPYFARGNLRGYYCAGAGEFAALPEAGLARVVGVETWFGRRFLLVTPEIEIGASN